MSKIIFNSKHIDIIKDLTAKSDEVIIISPFLSFIEDFNIGDYNVDLKLYTKVSENTKECINAARYLVLEHLIETYSNSDNNLSLYDVSDLHSKIYIFLKRIIPPIMLLLHLPIILMQGLKE